VSTQPYTASRHGTPSLSTEALERFVDLTHLHQANPERYPHLLESVSHGTPQARYDILFAFPGNTLSLYAGNRLRRDRHVQPETDFLAALDRDWLKERINDSGKQCGLPFRGGWFLFLGYELAAAIEPRLADHMVAAEDIPVAQATRFPAAIIRDHVTGMAHLVCEADHAADLLPAMRNDVMQTPAETASTSPVGAQGEEEDPRRYLRDVQRIQAYIAAGDVFQVNLSRAWRIRLNHAVKPVELYRMLRRSNPAPFAGFCNLENGAAIVSSSPERLICVVGNKVHTRPIAGTYPRSNDPRQDRSWSEELLLHPKERAEHIMLLDLERNELGRICRLGSVQVNERMVLESYRHVHHIVSEVSGELQAGVTPAQVIRAVFPGGTITGCPKLRCMEIIAELEQTARGAYTGSMGYLNRDGSMDLNILIRSMVLHNGQISLRAGAGIVTDSDPERELRETRTKAQGLLAALDLAPP
jgi:anthranilate synthase component 1